MNYNSPKYSNKVNPQYRFSDEFKSPFTSPQNHSGQGFSPFSYSSPKYNRTKMRYYNNSNASTNSSNSNGSPYKFHRQQHYNKNGRGSLDSPNISLYYDPTMTENPWAELEKEWEEKKEMSTNTENDEKNTTSE